MCKRISFNDILHCVYRHITLYPPVPHIFGFVIFYYHIKYHILNMSKIKCGINQQEVTSILSNLDNFHSLEVVDRVSETQLQVGENSN